MQKIIHGDCLEEMRKMQSNSIDCIITDPPYGISFMEKDWDRGIPSIEYWKEVLRIAKPGAHLLAAGLPRIIHRLICVIEDAGWQVRDLLMHLFGQGFPKSHNFGRRLDSRWNGYGTALKPAWEGWTLCMKPLDITFAENSEKWGVAGLNIDECRIPTKETLSIGSSKKGLYQGGFGNGISQPQNEKGRWPANLILDEEVAELLDHQSGLVASRFFYCAKASSSERNAGLEGMNYHPTVKPLNLMQYLLKLVMPPNPDAIILDPFAGSGTTILAAKNLGVNAIGIEKEGEYVEIATARLGKDGVQ